MGFIYNRQFVHPYYHHHDNHNYVRRQHSSEENTDFYKIRSSSDNYFSRAVKPLVSTVNQQQLTPEDYKFVQSLVGYYFSDNRQ